MTKLELKRRIKDLEQQVKFLQAQLAAALAGRTIVVPAPVAVPVQPVVPNMPSPWTPTRPYIGDPGDWPHNPTITCKSNTDVNSNRAHAADPQPFLSGMRSNVQSQH